MSCCCCFCCQKHESEKEWERESARRNERPREAADQSSCRLQDSSERSARGSGELLGDRRREREAGISRHSLPPRLLMLPFLHPLSPLPSCFRDLSFPLLEISERASRRVRGSESVNRLSLSPTLFRSGDREAIDPGCQSDATLAEEKRGKE